MKIKFSKPAIRGMWPQTRKRLSKSQATVSVNRSRRRRKKVASWTKPKPALRIEASKVTPKSKAINLTALVAKAVGEFMVEFGGDLSRVRRLVCPPTRWPE